jgi:predicted transcriptional regulator
VSLNAAKEALLKFLAGMPEPKTPMTQAELFEAAMIPSLTTGKKAINELLSAGQIERIGKGGQGHEYRYFVRKPKTAKSKVRQNQTIQAILKGEAE